MSNSAERSLVRSIALPAPPRIRTALRQPDAIEFDPSFTFAREAPYMFTMSSSCPSLPNVGNPRPASTSVLPSHDHPEPSLKERLERRVMSNDRSFHEGVKIATFRSNQRKNTVKTMHLERERRIQRLHHAAQERIDRWTEKTKESPFTVDQWAEDEKIYEINQRNNKVAAERQQKRAAKIDKSRGAQFSKAFSEVDELEILRKEKKKLVEHQKELKARMDLEKVNKRLAAAQQKQDLHKKGLENKLRKRGTLLRAHSDFFTDPLLDITRVEEEEEDSSLQARQSLIQAMGGEDAAAEPGTSSDSQNGPMSLARTMEKVQAEIQADDAKIQTPPPESPQSQHRQVRARATLALAQAARDGSLAEIMANHAQPPPPETEEEVSELGSESLVPGASASSEQKPSEDDSAEQSISPAASTHPTADVGSESAGFTAESTSPAAGRPTTADGVHESASAVAEVPSEVQTTTATESRHGEDDAAARVEAAQPISPAGATPSRPTTSDIKAESVTTEARLATENENETRGAGAQVAASRPTSPAASAPSRPTTSNSRAGNAGGSSPAAVAASRPTSPAAVATSRPTTSNSRAGSAGGSSPAAVAKSRPTSPASVTKSRPNTSNSRAGNAGVSSPAASGTSRPTTSNSRVGSPASPATKVPSSRATSAGSRASAFKSGVGAQMLP